MENGTIDLVTQWLAQFSELNIHDSVASYAISISTPDLIDSLANILEEPKYFTEFLTPICNQLFQFYRLKDEKLRLFVFNFIPSLVGIHLSHCIQPSDGRKKFHCVDTLLLAIYNTELSMEDGFGSSRSFRIPSNYKPSIYHEPPTSHLNTLTNNPNTTDANFIKVESGFTMVPLYAVYKEQDYINAANRVSIMTCLMTIFYDHLSSMEKSALAALCRMALKILRRSSSTSKVINSILKGEVPMADSESLRNKVKIPLSSDFLVQLLNCVYICMFNGVVENGLLALEEIHIRAKMDLYSDVLLLINAIKNSLTANPQDHLSREAMGISVALSPAASTNVGPTSLKTAITNASFKTQKLPEDIPIVTSSSNTRRMQSISEDSP